MRQLIRVAEDAQADIAQHETIDGILRQLSDYFTDEATKAKPNYGMQWADVNLGPELSGTYYILFAETAGIDIPGLMFMFGQRKGRYPTGMNGKASKPVLDHDRLIFVWCTDGDDDASQVVKKVVYHFATRHVIKHELVHLFDQERRKTPPTKTAAYQEDPHSDISGYYNSPGEFNAYFHNLADRLLGMIRGMRQEPESAKDYAELYDYNPNFIAMLKGIMTPADFEGLRGYLKHLNERNRRRAIGRLYALHQYAGRLLTTSTPSD